MDCRRAAVLGPHAVDEEGHPLCPENRHLWFESLEGYLHEVLCVECLHELSTDKRRGPVRVMVEPVPLSELKP